MNLKLLFLGLICFFSSTGYAQFQNILIKDDLVASKFKDNTLLTLWAGNPAPVTGWEINNITRSSLTYRGASLSASAMANSSFSNPTGLKTLNSFDYFFPTIDRNNTTIKVEFDAVWDALNGGGESGRIVVSLMKDVPTGGAQFGQVNNLALSAPFGRPIYNIRIRNTSTVNGPLMLYGAGTDRIPSWEPYNPPGGWWLPGFSTQPCIGGVGCSPGTTGSFPNSPTRTSTIQAASATIWRHFTWLVKPERMELYYRNSSNTADILVFFMAIPKYSFPEDPANAIGKINAAHGTSITNLPTLYEWYNSPNAIRFFINGGTKAHIANIKVTREDPTINTWTGIQSSDWNNPYNWSNGAVPSESYPALIPSTANKPIINTSASVGELTLAPGAILRIQNSTGLLQINGNVSGGGVLNASNGSGVYVNNLNAGIFEGNHQLENLRVMAPSGLQLSGNINLTGILTLDGGAFDISSSNFSLLASDLKTAKIGIVAPGASIIGNINWERNVPPVVAWYFGSSPLTNTTLLQLKNSFAISGSFPGANGGNTNLFFYNPNAIKGWTSPDNITNTVGSGVGYRIFWNGQFINGSRKIKLNGPPRYGPYNLPLEYCTSACPQWAGSSTENGWNLVGNPYACEIDWHLLVKTNVAPSYYVWNKAAYGAYNQTTQLSINGVDRYIATGQGFFVQAENSGGGLGFNESAKVPIQNKSMLRSANQMTNAIKFKVKQDEAISDEAAIRWMEGASSGFDAKFDTRKLFGGTHQIYVKTNQTNESICIAAQPLEFNQTDSVEIRYRGPGGNNLKLDWGLIGVLDVSQIKVKNLLNNEIFDVDQLDGFKLELDSINQDTAVAIIYFKSQKPPKFEALSFENNLAYPNPSNGNFIVRVPKNEHLGSEIKWKIINSIGKMIMEGKSDIVDNEVRLNLQIMLSSGVYSVVFQNKEILFHNKLIVK